MAKPRWAVFVLAALLAAPAAAAPVFDADGVALGASERDIKQQFPGAYCKPLEWKTDAANRRCDDAQAVVAGASARITFYLKHDAVQAFHARFPGAEAQRVAAFLKRRYGKPLGEKTDTFFLGPGKPERKIYKVRWQHGKDQALFADPLNGGSATLEVWRGNFETELYQVK